MTTNFIDEAATYPHSVTALVREESKYNKILTSTAEKTNISVTVIKSVENSPIFADTSKFLWGVIQ